MPDRMDGAERRHWLLKDVGDLFAANRADPPAEWVQSRQVDRWRVARVIDDFAAHDTAWPGHDAQDRLGGDRLATARFADHAQRASPPKCVAQAVDGADGAFVQWEVHAQVAHLQQQRAVSRHYLAYG